MMNVQEIFAENKEKLLFSNDSKIIKLRENILKKFTKEYFNKKNNESIKYLDLNIIDKLMNYSTNSKNIFGIKILNLLITIFLNRTFRRSLNLIRLDLSINEKSSQEYFINNFNIADIPSLWENIFTQINKTYELNLDKRQAIIYMVENIKKLKIKKNVLD